MKARGYWAQGCMGLGFLGLATLSTALDTVVNNMLPERYAFKPALSVRPGLAVTRQVGFLCWPRAESRPSATEHVAGLQPPRQPVGAGDPTGQTTVIACLIPAMKMLAVALSMVATQAFGLAAAPSDQEAQRAHAQGSCGSMGPGTGLSGNKGWVVSMLPGRHQFRVRGGVGQVFVTMARQATLDFDAGRPYYIVIEGAGPNPVLEWKIPGSDWGPVSKFFLYPVSR